MESLIDWLQSTEWMPALIRWLTATRVSGWIIDYRWSWPIAETTHFFGLVLLSGTLGAFDLRLLGLGKGIRPADLHRLLRFGIAGLCLMVITGLWFISGTPDQYFYNKSFHLKVLALALAGTNAVLFYSLEFRSIRSMGPGDDAPARAKLMAAVSLTLLVAVMLFGRMLTFFRPPY